MLRGHFLVHLSVSASLFPSVVSFSVAHHSGKTNYSVISGPASERLVMGGSRLTGDLPEKAQLEEGTRR